MAYNLLDLQTSVLDDLKDPSFNMTRLTRYLNYGQLAIFNTHLFRFCEAMTSSALTPGALLKTQPADHQSTIGGVLVDPSNTSRQWRLDESTYLAADDFFDRYPVPSLYTAGTPDSWTEYGGLIYFSRPIDVAYTFSQRYYKVPTSLSAGTDVPSVPEAFRELLELYAVYRAEKYRGNHDIAATYKQDFEDGLEAMALRFSPVTHVAAPQMRNVRMRVSE